MFLPNVTDKTFHPWPSVQRDFVETSEVSVTRTASARNNHQDNERMVFSEKRYTVLDLYAGAGGLSLGFKNAGFKLAGAVEIDAWASDTYEKNLNVPVLRKKVSDLTADDLAKFKKVDVVCGGPPCQGFSIAAKGRGLRHDPRNDEVFNFIDVAIKLEPKFIVIENVAQFEKYQMADGGLLIDKVRFALTQSGFQVSTHLLNAVNFGVPQNRMRFFLVATSGDRLPNLLKYERDSSTIISLLTVKEALSDLPAVEPRKVDDDAVMSYLGEAQNDYQRRLRSKSGVYFNHVPMRHTPRLIERFAQIQIGSNGCAVWDKHAPRKRGSSNSTGSKFEQNHRRMNPNAPAPTITAYMYSSCLHPYQHRNITVREAARLQSFPDEFQFTGKRTTLSNKLLERKGLLDDIGLDQFNQVGNAVPPLLAEGLAAAIMKEIVNV